jgi:hypothetical protein
MFGLPLIFTVPLALGALAGLPLLYFLLRTVPPRPQRIPFPPLRLILDLIPKEQTPVRTPWWILLLRLAITACVILAMAGPILNPTPAGEAGDGPLVIVLDNGWPAAPTFEDRSKAAAQRIEAAGRSGRPVAIIATSDAGREILASDAPKALERLRAITPSPFIPDRLKSLPALEQFTKARPKTSLVWIADSVEQGNGHAFAQALAKLDVSMSVVTDQRPVQTLSDARNEGSALKVHVARSAAAGPELGQVNAYDLKGARIGEASFDFTHTQDTEAQFTLPIELRNDIARLEIAGEHSAGAVSLLDESWKRRRVDIVSGETAELSLPLLAPNYYVMRALTPYADVHDIPQGAEDPIATALADHPAVIILADVGVVTGETHEKLKNFVEAGGLLLRFAGTHLASASDDLVPVRLRRGGRVLGGSLSWETPKALAPFDRQSPFAGLEVPSEVKITRQVLAEPEAGLAAKTWAQLSDGTPLVTSQTRGKGMIVLFHVTADTTWSNLPLSGLFVDMLRKVMTFSVESSKNRPDAGSSSDKASQAAPDTKGGVAMPRRTLDGFGNLGAPPVTAKPIPTNFQGIGDAEHPPGFYGPPDALIAVNALAPGDKIVAANYSDLQLKTSALQASEPVDLRPWLITLAFVLFLLDTLASIWLAGGLKRSKRQAVAALLALALGSALGLATPMPSHAQPAKAITETLSPDQLQSALSTRLAYVLTGDAQVDEISQEGLLSLSRVLAARTSLTPGTPVGVDPARDELAFFPMLYWPIVATAAQPSPAALSKIAAFMKQGGTIVFDTRDALTARPDSGGSPASLMLKHMLDGLDIPELEPVPADHVVTKTFYLLDGFLGRYSNGQTWIEALPPAPEDGSSRPARSGDSVSPIVITSNDLAAGWASDQMGDSLYPLVPGGRRQHELALRGGVNLVMYTLTGNYKADQVHVRDLLERLAH